MEFLPGISHSALFGFLVQISVLLLLSRILGDIAVRSGHSSVIGELFAGILLGPSLLSGFFPEISAFLLPGEAETGQLLEMVSIIGSMFLLLLTGLEIDTGLIKRHYKTALAVSILGVTFTFTGGFILAGFIPEKFADPKISPVILSMFFATAMSVSAIPVLAKVLMDLGYMRRSTGQTMIAAAMSDDTIAWILLAVTISLSAGTTLTVGHVSLIAFKTIGVLFAMFLLGTLISGPLFRFVIHKLGNQEMVLSLILAFMFAFASIGHAFHIEAVLGAFIFGIVLGRVSLISAETKEQIRTFTFAFFSPLFFAAAGLKVDMSNLADPSLLLFTVLTVVVAVGAEVTGAFVGARFIGKKSILESLSYGMGLSAKGAMQVIVATIGYTKGIITGDIFSVIVITSIVTSMLAPPALRVILQRVKPDKEEIERLRHEELMRSNPFSNLTRVLLPVRKTETIHHETRITEAKIINRLQRNQNFSLGLFTVSPKGKRSEGNAYLNSIRDLFSFSDVEKKVVSSANPADAIIQETGRHYDLLMIGAPLPEKKDAGIFSPNIDNIIRSARIPTLIISGRDMGPAWQPSRILVPVSGTEAGRRAARLAFAIAGKENLVVILNVLKSTGFSWMEKYSPETRQKMQSHEAMVREIVGEGVSLGIKSEGVVLSASNTESEVLAFAEKNGIDLIILGSAVSTGSERLFLGPRIENILARAKCPVAVVNAG